MGMVADVFDRLFHDDDDLHAQLCDLIAVHATVGSPRTSFEFCRWATSAKDYIIRSVVAIAQ
jgi:hypothetical protein